MIVSYEKEVDVMSVIMAYKTEDKIYLGADNRLSEQDGTPIEDENKKLVIVNKYLAIAFSGNAGTQYFFEKFKF